jgi:hypothetical protein
MASSSGISGRLCVVVPESEQRFWASFRMPDSFSAYTAKVEADGNLVLANFGADDQGREPVCFCLCCVDAANVAFLASLKSNRDFYHYFSNAEIVCTHSIDYLKVLFEVLHSLGKYVDPLVGFATEQALALSAARRAYDEVHYRFSALETYFRWSGAALSKERKFIAPDEVSKGVLSTIKCVSPLRQILPVSSLGLCAIALHAQTSAAGDAPQACRIRLFLGDASQPVGDWTLDLRQAEPNQPWRSFALPAALSGIPRSAFIEVEALGEAAEHVALALGPVVANPEYCVMDGRSHAPATNRPLAMRLWGAPPGVSITHGLPVHLSAQSTPAPGPYRLQASSMRSVEALAGVDGFDFDPVIFNSDDDSILVHPPAQGICAGVLRRIVPAGAISVSATGFVASADSEPVEFAIALVDDKTAAGRRWSEFEQAPEPIVWSGWRTIAHPDRHQMSVYMPGEAQAPTPLSLMMLTRMKHESGNAFAWARFTDIVIERN